MSGKLVGALETQADLTGFRDTVRPGVALVRVQSLVRAERQRQARARRLRAVVPAEIDAVELHVEERAVQILVAEVIERAESEHAHTVGAARRVGDASLV